LALDFPVIYHLHELDGTYRKCLSWMHDNMLRGDLEPRIQEACAFARAQSVAMRRRTKILSPDRWELRIQWHPEYALDCTNLTPHLHSERSPTEHVLGEVEGSPFRCQVLPAHNSPQPTENTAQELFPSLQFISPIRAQ
jgi:hypothetical protein